MNDTAQKSLGDINNADLINDDYELSKNASEAVLERHIDLAYSKHPPQNMISEHVPIYPTWARVLVEHLDVKESDETFANTSIVIPETALDREQRAQTKALLIAVGADAFDGWDKSGTIPEVNDIVIVEKYLGVIVKYGGKTYHIINDDQILAVLGE